MIYITGGSGFIGRYLTSELLIKGTPFQILSRDSHIGIKTDYSVNHLQSIFSDGDTIVHLAGIRSSNSPAAFQDNINLTVNICDAAKQKNVERIVMTSTISVYSDVRNLPWVESDARQPESAYGLSKLNSERILNDLSSETDIITISLRLAHVFGAFEKNNYMVNKFLNLAFNGQPLVLYNNEPAHREFIYVKDVVRALRLALSYDKSDVFNIGTKSRLTNLEVAQTINRVMKNEKLTIENGEIGLIPPSYMDSSKALSELNFSAKYTFEDAVEEIYQLMLDETLVK